MAYDEHLADRIAHLLEKRGDVVTKKMFGGFCFMVSGHMCCGIVGDELMARVGPEQYADALATEHAREMDFTGRSMKGMVYVSNAGIDKDADLKKWIDRCLTFVTGLPPK